MVGKPLQAHLVLLGVTKVLLDEGSPGVGEGTEAVGDAVAPATVVLIDGGEILMSIVDFRRCLKCVTELIDVFVVDKVLKCFGLHFARLHVDEVPGDLKISRGAQVSLLS